MAVALFPPCDYMDKRANGRLARYISRSRACMQRAPVVNFRAVSPNNVVKAVAFPRRLIMGSTIESMQCVTQPHRQSQLSPLKYSSRPHLHSIANCRSAFALPRPTSSGIGVARPYHLAGDRHGEDRSGCCHPFPSNCPIPASGSTARSDASQILEYEAFAF